MVDDFRECRYTSKHMSEKTHTTIQIPKDVHSDLKVKSAQRNEKVPETAAKAIRIGLKKLSPHSK